MAVRLGPIYDALDSGDYKNSLRLIRNLEHRHGPDAILFALKALALVRSDHVQEASIAARQFVECRPVEPAILETAVVVFKELHRYDWNREAYEAAAERCPSNETILTGLYFAYLREWSFLKQQQTAMRLFKMSGSEKYLHWASVCIELQNGALSTPALLARGGDIPTESASACRFLQLASMVLEKHSQAGAMSPKCLYQYVRILRRLGRHEAIVQALQDRADLDPVLQLELARSLMSLNSFNDAALILNHLLTTRNPDDWRYLKMFVDAHVALCSAFEGSDAMAFLYSMRSAGQRGPWLAQIYAAFLQNLEPDRHIIEYFHEFGHRKSFFPDVQPWLGSTGNADALLTAMYVGTDAVADHDVRRRSSYEMCWRSLRFHQQCSNDDLVAKARSLYDIYTRTINPNKERTEFGAGDDLCLLCVYTLIDLYDRDRNPSILFQAAAVLTVGLRSSPHNFQLLLLLIRLYAQLGAFTGAFEHYAALDTKSIQLDTLTHLVQDDAIRFGFLSHAVALASAVVSHYDMYDFDAPDLVVLCHVKDNFDQIVEFTQFRERLRRSFRLAESRQVLHFSSHYLDKHVSCAAMRMELPPVVNTDDLLSNDDYALLLHPDKERGASLSRSSSFLHEESWHPVTEQSRRASLRLLHTFLALTDAMARANPESIHQHVSDLGQELSQIGVLDLSEPVSPSRDGFVKQHWRYCILIFQCAASLSQTWSLSLSYIEGNSSDHATVVDGWSGVHRQSTLIQISLQQLTQTLLDGLDHRPDSMAAYLATYLNFASRWSVLLLDLSATLLPGKRNAFDKLVKKKGGGNIMVENDVWGMLAELLGAMSSLKSTCAAGLESVRGRLESVRSASNPAIDFRAFAIKQLETETDVIESVQVLLGKSRIGVCNHALDSIALCLKSLSVIT